MACDESAGRSRVLIIGDSVFDELDHVESARELLDSQQKTIFAVQGCPKLVEPGCFAWVKLSALDQLKKNAGRFSDVVVIGAGYNDRIGVPFQQAVMAITQEAALQGVDVVWITYRQVRHVRGNATTINKQLGNLESKIERRHVVEWLRQPQLRTSAMSSSCRGRSKITTTKSLSDFLVALAISLRFFVGETFMSIALAASRETAIFSM